MNQYSRGKRLLELSLQKVSRERKQRRLSKSPEKSQPHDNEPSILNISASQLIELPEELDLSISGDDISFTDLPPLSAALKVANYIMNDCTGTPTNVRDIHNIDEVVRSAAVEDSGSASANDVSDVFHSLNVFESGKMLDNDAREVLHEVSAVMPFDNRIKGERGRHKRRANEIVVEAREMAVKDAFEMEKTESVVQCGDLSARDIVAKGENENVVKVGDGPSKDIFEIGETGDVTSRDVVEIGETGDVTSRDVVEIGETGDVPSRDVVEIGETGDVPSRDVVEIGETGDVPSRDVVEIGGGENVFKNGDMSARVVVEIMESENAVETGEIPSRDVVNAGESELVVQLSNSPIRRYVEKEENGNMVESGDVGGRDMVEMGGSEDIIELEDRPAREFGENPGGKNTIVAEADPKRNLENAEMAAFACNSSTKVPKKEDQKQRRQFGKAYVGRHFDKETNKCVEVNKREQVLGPRCACKASYYHCKQVSNDDRGRIHRDVWSMSWEEKKVFVRMAIDVKDVSERKGASGVPRRNNTLIFTLKGAGERKRVCKEMFLSTTGLKKWWVLNVVTSEASPSHEERQGRAQISQGLNFVKEFLDRLPKMPSHYCRKDTNKLYLEPMFQSYADIYREYSSVCEAEGKTKMSRTVFVGELKASNISIFVPRKDQCDLCCEFSQGNADETEYNRHRERKEYAQTEKAKDKEAHGHDCRTKVLCVDVQRVLLTPCLKASALYYKTKLQVHNYTVFDLTSKDVVCFVWNEVEGGLNASEFASCLVSYLEGIVDSFDKAIIYSDGCTYQNRNRVLATALRFFCVRYGKTVEQKILERGHTQMEVDSVHATIERRLKNMDIFVPLDYVNLIKVSRTSPRPYEVRYLTFDFFRDFEKIEEGAIKSIKPSKEANVTNICALRYSHDGTVAFKLNFADEWQTLSLGRRDKVPTVDPSKLYKSRRKIKKSKYDHLQALKSVLPAEVHPFYDALPHQ